MPAAAALQPPAAWTRTDVWLVFGLLALTAVPFAQVAWFDFVDLDDPQYVTEVELVQRGIEPLALWDAFGFHAFNWHPLVWWSLMLDYQLSGMQPAWFHVVNLGWHLANVALLFADLKELTGDRWRSAAVAAVFGVHPLHVESVAWVSERKDVLSGFFWMLALWAYARWVRRGHGKWIVTVALVLGLMSKQIVVTLPCVFLLLDAWPLGRIFEPKLGRTVTRRVVRLIIEKLPWLAIVALACWMTLQAQDSARAGWIDWPLSLRFSNAALSYVRYLAKTFWPVGLCVQYSFNPPASIWPVVAAAGLLLLLTVIAIVFVRRCPAVLVGWLWYLGTLVPVIGVIQVGKQPLADRYMYLPLIGLAIAATWMIPNPRSRPVRAAYGIASVLLCAVLGMLTARQTAVWRDTVTLFRHAYHVDPTNEEALFTLGSRALNEGRIDEGLRLLHSGVEWDRKRWSGRWAFAGVKHRSTFDELNRRWADVYYTLGSANINQGHDSAGIADFREAIGLNDQHADARLALASALLDHGNAEEALREIDELLQRQPLNQRAVAVRHDIQKRLEERDSE
jgi:hypothetical protein